MLSFSNRPPIMRVSDSFPVIFFWALTLGLPSATWPQSDRTQSDRDFVFTGEDGHLVIRFAGTGATGLDASQAYEVLNQEFSRMIHDRLHADLQFAAEPPDPDWAASMEPQIAEHLRHAGPEFSDIFVACRAATCRVIMEQPAHWDVPEHRDVLETVQGSLEHFIAAHRPHFEPTFMITAYDKQSETAHIKAFLRRTTQAAPERPAGQSLPPGHR